MGYTLLFVNTSCKAVSCNIKGKVHCCQVLLSNMEGRKVSYSSWGERKFCDFADANIESAVKTRTSHEGCRKLCEYIESQCLGSDFEFTGPFGKRKGTLRICILN